MPRNHIKAVLFDKDGTLLHFDASWRPALLRAASEASGGDEELALRLLTSTGYDADTGSVRTGSIIGAGNTQDIAAAWASSGARIMDTPLVEVLDRIFSSAMYDAIPISGLKPTIGLLKTAGYILGVASSDSAAAIRIFLEAAGVSDSFDFIVGYDSGHGHKPDPGMLTAFCAAMDLVPAQVAMVGDNPQDLQMARSAGAGLRVGVLTGNSRASDLEPLADMILEDITSLPNALGVT